MIEHPRQEVALFSSAHQQLGSPWDLVSLCKNEEAWDRLTALDRARSVSCFIKAFSSLADLVSLRRTLSTREL